ncbi:MAG TPA: Gfo/Idh/MocA family oxidoreductase [Flavobacteriaceae bacterium]|nr:Gfo/Idh/MocA family oxidoreductase [Flavobacteriaceae bacterium]
MRKTDGMLKIGVLGAGHLGKIHLRLAQQSEKYELAGFFDLDKTNAENLVKEFGYHLFDSAEELIAAVDVVDIVTPTLSHFEIAKKALEAGKHIFVEKPITYTYEEAETLMKMAQEKGVKGQVGHVERFNPAFQAVEKMIDGPMFVEAHRLAEFNPRGTDVPVVLDLMIHDIEAVLSVVHSDVAQINASGVSVISKTPDICNARVQFENGCVANFTASRISLKSMRKQRYFQRDAYISIDFLEKKAEVVRIEDVPEKPDDYAMILQNAEGEKKQISFDNPEIKDNNAILEELDSLADAINQDTTPRVTLQQGADALKVANKIMDRINKQYERLKHLKLD